MTTNCLEELSNVIKENNIELDTPSYSNPYTKKISFTVGFLIGVEENHLKNILQSDREYSQLLSALNTNENALVFRNLNVLRTKLMLNFKDISHKIKLSSHEYIGVERISYLKDIFSLLSNYGITSINDASGNIDNYIYNINNEITNRIDNIKDLFPSWVEFKHLRFAFTMPKNIKEERERFQHNHDLYPYQKYFHWTNPYDNGNILFNDGKLLEVLYENNGDMFNDIAKVSDASLDNKNRIKDFITHSNKVRIFVDSENCDPYRFQSMLDSLRSFEIDKIDRIVIFYDVRYSNPAWKQFNNYSYSCDIDVEIRSIERIKENKSLVDQELAFVVGEAKFKDGVDSFIIASSDSDFWSIINKLDGSHCLVLMEYEKRAYEYTEKLRENDVFYCYLDSFKAPGCNTFTEEAIKNEFEKVIGNDLIGKRASELLNEAVRNSHAEISKKEKEMLFSKFFSNLEFVINSEGCCDVKLTV